MTCLHVFDMDGTLLHGSATLEISRSFGVFEETLRIEQAWVRGELSDGGFWEQCLPLWQGLDDMHIDDAFAKAPWLDGVRAVFDDIRARDEYSVVISQSPKFFVDRLTGWGAGYAHGALVTPGNTQGADELLSSDDKLSITDRLLGELTLERDTCVVYGDSSSDIALFESLPHKVGVNPKGRIRDLATVVYEGTDLWRAYLAGRALLRGGSHP